MPGYVQDELPPEEVDRQRALYGPLAEAVRDLVDATIRTTVDDDEVRAVQLEVEELTARLRKSQLDGAYGVRFSRGRGRPWGNPVVGLRNAVAPPVVIEHDPSANGDVWADFHLGAAYEGPPGLVHGGVSALILDQVLGEAAGAGGKPGMTGTLTLRYHRPTPLFVELTVQARQVSVDGRKIRTTGEILANGEACVSADGLFVNKHLPRPR